MDQSGPLFFIVAGEVSGDALAAGLITQLRNLYPDARFKGVTGPEMLAAGCESLADIDSLSLFGVAEVITQIPRLLRLRNRLFEEARQAHPNVFIGVDAPAFNTRLEERLRREGIKTVHYVCPTVWAWRAGRIHSIRRAVDLMLSIFPFEPDFFAAHDVPVTFVGHPLTGQLPVHESRDMARQSLALQRDVRWVGLLPGSRGAEVDRLGKRFFETARWLVQRDPALRFVIPAANAKIRHRLEALLDDFADLDALIVDGRAREVMQAANVLLVASGTATLEALLIGTPMVVAYELSPLNYWIARGLNLIKTEFVSMPNLMAGREVVPELLQQQARAPMLGSWLYRLLHSETARRGQTEAFEDIRSQLAGDADVFAARAVAELIA